MKTKAVRLALTSLIVVGAFSLWCCATPSVCDTTDSAEVTEQKGTVSLPETTHIQMSEAELLALVDSLGLRLEIRNEKYTPITHIDVSEARTAVEQALATLKTRLAQDGQNGLDWAKYLQLDELQKQLAQGDQADLEKIAAIYSRLNQDYHGLELVWFVDLKDSLGRYLNLSRAVGNPEIEAAYKNLLEKTLPERLESFKADQSPATAHEVGLMLGWLSDFNQAEPLVSLIRKQCAKQNLFLEVSEDFIAAGMAGPVDETTPISDVILGTTICGTGKTKGNLDVATIPSDDKGVIGITLSATTESDNVGYHGPVRIYSTGVTTFEGRKQLTISSEGITALPAESEAKTSSTVNCISSRRGSQMIERAAWKRVGKQKCKAEMVAAQHAECRINQRMDGQADELVADANERFQKRLRRPLTERKIFPEQFVISTTADKLNVQVLRAAYNQLAAPNDPPELAEPADVAVRVHQSMINNSTATLLAGRRVTEEEFLNTVEDILGEVPENLKPDEEKASWAIHFAPAEAFTVTFGDGGFTVSLHAVGYTRGDNDYPGMNVSASYKIEKTDEGTVAVRQGDLEIYPPDFVKGERQLSGREQTLRKLLEKRFAKIFSEKIVPRGYLQPKGRWEKIGRVPLTQWSTKDGWMTLAWKRAEM